MNNKFTWPVDGDRHINSRFRTTSRPRHNGVDIRARNNRKILAVADGIITRSEYHGSTQNNQGWGNLVQITHANGLMSLYAHLSERKVMIGQSVSQGDVIGLSGHTGGTFGSGITINGVRRSTGHLHFETTQDGSHFDPLTLDYK